MEIFFICKREELQKLGRGKKKGRSCKKRGVTNTATMVLKEGEPQIFRSHK